MQLQIKKYRLPLKHTFRISRASRDFQDTLIVSLGLNGQIGFGEATVSDYYQAHSEQMKVELEQLRTALEAFHFTNPETFYAFLSTTPLHTFTRCALDIASHDLYGKLMGKPLYEIWNTPMQQYPLTNYTIGLAPIDQMISKIKEKAWPIYKIKLGTPEDLHIIHQLRMHTDAVFRVDANCAWTPEETITNAPILKDLGVEFIEQPLKADNWEGMQLVRQHTVLPIIADESCMIETDIEKCVDFFDGVNIKLMKCGGLTPALRMIEHAKSLNLKIMVGCMTESTVGISAIAQLLPQLDYVDMDGAMLLKEDIAAGVQILNNAEVRFPKTNGTGVTLHF